MWGFTASRCSSETGRVARRATQLAVKQPQTGLDDQINQTL
jgi:hypothetical protein